MTDTSWLFEILRQLRLVLWKNLIIRKRQYIVTAIEIILPSLFAIFIAYGRSKIPDSSQTRPAEFYDPVNERVSSLSIPKLCIYSPSFGHFIHLNAQEIVANLFNSRRTNRTYGYTPVNEFTTNFTNQIQQQIFQTYPNQKSLKWLPFENENAIEQYAAQIPLERKQGDSSKQFDGALVFNGLQSFYSEDHSKNKKLGYKIRLVNEFEDTKSLTLSILGYDSTYPACITLFKKNRKSSLYNNNYCFTDEYHSSGFSALQILIDKLIVKMLFTSESEYHVAYKNELSK